MMELNELSPIGAFGYFLMLFFACIAVFVIYTSIESIIDSNNAEEYCKANGYNEVEPVDNEEFTKSKGRCVKLIPRFGGVGFDKEYSGYFDYDDIKEDLQ